MTGDLSLAQGREIFEARLQALARTQRQLTSTKRDTVSLEEIIRSEFDAFPSQMKIDGDEIFLDYQQAQKFSLAVHELTINAVKYGALSAPTGGVKIAWSISANGSGHELKFSLGRTRRAARYRTDERRLWQYAIESNIRKNTHGVCVGGVFL